MKPYHQYWTFSAIRGAMTLLASLFIIAVPLAASSVLSIPVLVALAIDCLAAYSFFDGSVMVLLAKMLPARATNLRTLYAQAIMAATTGTFLFLIVYGALSVRWVMWVVAVQALFAAGVELAVAKNTHRQYGCVSCYATVMILAASAVCLPFAGGLSATGMSLALATYVGAYGMSELLLSWRMLFLEYRAVHPAKQMSSAWKLEMDTKAAQTLSVASWRTGPVSVPASVLPAAA